MLANEIDANEVVNNIHFTPNFPNNPFMVDGWLFPTLTPPNSFIHNQMNCEYQANMDIYP